MASSLLLDDAKTMLSITVDDFDTELQRKIDAIEASLERVCGGPIVSRSVTERVELTDCYSAIMLRKRPVVSVTSIVVVSSGTSLSTTDLDIDTNSGIVRRKLGLLFVTGVSPIVTVTYTAGLGSTAPAAVVEADAIILKHLWASRRGLTGSSPEALVNIPGMGYAIPLRAAELLAPYTLEAYV